MKDFKTEILAISLSPGEQYFVESGNDQLVKVFHYPQMVQLFEIAFFTYVKVYFSKHYFINSLVA